MNKNDKLFHKHIKDLRPKVVFEFGSFDLEHSVYYRGLWPKASIYSFEPDFGLFQAGRDLAGDANIKLHNCAIGSVNAEVLFYPTAFLKGGGGPSGSMLRHTLYHKERQKEYQNFPEPVLVECRTISSICENYDIKDIDFMHVDVEGATIDVLEGFGDIRPKVIRMEVNGRDTLFEGAPTAKQVNITMAAMGYSIKLTHKKSADILYKHGN